MPKTVLIVPCYNEEARLDRAEFLRLVRARRELELLFVDDGSRDGTPEVIQSMRAIEPRVDLHRLDRNRGKAEAVRQGLVAALGRGAAVVGYTDADLATPVDELLRLLSVLEERPGSVLLGSRVRLLGMEIERRATRHYLGRIFATIASLALGLEVYDTQCGAKLFRRSRALEAAVSLPFRSRWAFDVELLGRLLRGSAAAGPLPAGEFREVPLSAWRDASGSKLRFGAMLRAGLDLVAMLLRWRLRRAVRWQEQPDIVEIAGRPAAGTAEDAGFDDS